MPVAPWRSGMEAARPTSGSFALFTMKQSPKRCRIVLTGGPGGGKTTAADLFRREIGDRVVIVPEAATILFAGGFPAPARSTPDVRPCPPARYRRAGVLGHDDPAR